MVPALLVFSISAQCQYYYKDVVDGRLMNERIKSYVQHKVQTVTATGYDARGAKSADFNEYQDLFPAQRLLRITTRNGQQVNRQYFRFDEQQRLVSITDTVDDVRTVITYTYDNRGNISTLHSSVNDAGSQYAGDEERQWVYDGNGRPLRMWRIVNGTDSSEYRFTHDDQGNVVMEQMFKRDYGFDSVMYYYDERNRLTDVVRYDRRVKQLLPDFMFEYDEQNRVIQKITIVSTTNRDYLIWRYLFNEKGLKTKEALFNKNKELTGRIEYTYNFTP